MRNHFHSLCLSLSAAVLATQLFIPTRASAVSVTYNVVGGSSSLTLSGQAFGLAYGGQGGNSSALVDSWTGTITGDLNAGVLTFSGGSSITAVLHPLGPFSTSPLSVPTSGLDNYGVNASGFVTGLGVAVVNGIYRNLSLDITAGSVTSGLAPSGTTLTFTGTSKLDYGILLNGSPYPPVGGGSSSLLNVSGANTASALVALDSGTGYGSTLVLPVTFHTIGSNRFEDWTGTLIAVVPEPSSLGLFALGLTSLLAIRNRKVRS